LYLLQIAGKAAI